jgi:hypothetical protein
MISEETRQKMSESHSGEKHWLFGKHHSPETCEKIRKTNTGSGNWNYGRTTPDSVKEKQRLAATNKHPTEETKAKMRAAKIGKIRGPYKRCK